MNPTIACAACHSTANRRHLCDACLGQLTQKLQRLHHLWAEAGTTVGRQDRLTRESGRSVSGSDTPLLLNVDVAGTLAQTEVSLRRWHRVACHAPDARRSAEGAIADLIDSARYLARRTLGADVLRWARNAVSDLHDAIDIPPDRHYLGRCDRCGRDLFAAVDDTVITCICKGAQPQQVDQLRREVIAAMRDKLATATEAARLLTAYGPRIGESTIRRWAHRGWITARGQRGTDGALYSLDEILTHLER